MSIPISTRFEVLRRDKFRCRYCLGRPGYDELEVDHVVPRSAGGGDRPGNLVTACWDCNRGKAARRLSREEIGTVTEGTGRWGRWEFDGEFLSIFPLPEVDPYEICLRDITSGADVARWVTHLREKSWTLADDVRDFYLAVSFLTPYGREALREPEIFA